ncbi:GNAT family N-acetyltransferase [Actinoalloteichus hymeniacidonis]|uniref:Acetyltransferase, ribosomal protein N-acetylase n=1 Tax=Actinoalloteichus hymeniacidonis TaxID=340345 RepID=A0AAC9HLN8_9PSEU|nr:GNAT family protein [Actinoalloteichus hymeniacidonis]AOS61160.1 acetyltransferase, ribosomal protein N-acetylase [Actinoalloteichus hymeniacidonis]MBB5910839.1 RimJ/RimL family protein N-acetyltransferase [Actinoalloteichus hymeniacidonis]
MGNERHPGTVRAASRRAIPPGRAADLRDLPIRSDGRVLLRAWQIDDLPAIIEAADDPYIPLITTIPAGCSMVQASAWLRRQWTQAAEGFGIPLAIIDESTGESAGMVTINGIDWTHRRGAMGYWLLPRHRGKGLARAAVELTVGLARDLDLLRVEALVEVDNGPSQAVCRANGFAEEGTLRSYLRIGERHRDMIMFSRLLSGS